MFSLNVSLRGGRKHALPVRLTRRNPPDRCFQRAGICIPPTTPERASDAPAPNPVAGTLCTGQWNSTSAFRKNDLSAGPPPPSTPADFPAAVRGPRVDARYAADTSCARGPLGSTVAESTLGRGRTPQAGRPLRQRGVGEATHRLGAGGVCACAGTPSNPGLLTGVMVFIHPRAAPLHRNRVNTRSPHGTGDASHG